MRTFFTLVGAIAFTVLNAQTITSADAPTVGYTFSWQTSAWYGALSTGSGQTWDMSAATPSGGAEVFTYILPSLAPGSAQFPDADLALQPAGSLTTASFIDVQPDGLYGLGSYDSGGPVTALFSDVENTMRYPCTVGTTWTDFAAYDSQVSGTPISSGADTSTYTADGSGTLILPNGTFTDVLRITHTSSETAVSFGTTYVTTKDEVIFRKTGTQEVLASTIHHVYYTNGSQSGELFQSYYLVPIVAGIVTTEAATGLSLFPNPANGIVRIKANAIGAMEMTVTDALGRTVHAEHFPIGNGMGSGISLDVSTWDKGAYHVTARDKAGNVSVQRLVVN